MTTSTTDLKTECIKGYFPEDTAHEIRQLARRCGMSTSHFVRHVIEERVISEKIVNSPNVINLRDFN